MSICKKKERKGLCRSLPDHTKKRTEPGNIHQFCPLSIFLPLLLYLPRTADTVISRSFSSRSKFPPSSTVTYTSYSVSAKSVSGVVSSSVRICHSSPGTSCNVPSVPYAYSFNDPASPEIPFMRRAIVVFGCTFSTVTVFSQPSTPPVPPSASNVSCSSTVRVA